MTAWGKCLRAQGLRLEAANEVAHVVDRLVEGGAGLIEAGHRLRLFGAELGADAGEAHARGVERLDDAVVQVAAEAGALLEIFAQGCRRARLPNY